MGIVFVFAILFPDHSATEYILGPWHTLDGYLVPGLKQDGTLISFLTATAHTHARAHAR